MQHKRSLFLVRHAPSQKTAEDRHGKTRVALGLTPRGHEAAISSAKILANRITVDALFASEDLASCETAGHFGKELRLATRTSAYFDPIDFGVVSGLSRRELQLAYPDVAEQILLYEAGTLHPKDYRIPGAETSGAFEFRIRQGMRAIESSDWSAALLVGHRSTITMLLNICWAYPNFTDGAGYERPTLEPLSVAKIGFNGLIEEGSVEFIGRSVSTL